MIKNYTMNDGREIPAIGLGTWQSSKDDAYKAVRAAIDCGYTHIDTAFAYENEDAVGKAVKDSGIGRENIFITTKLPSHIKTFDGTLEYCEKSLGALGTDYIDLYLIHAPWPWSDPGTDCTAGNIEAWKAMIKLQKEGKLRSIGVSNFRPFEIDPIVEATGVVPAANQIRFFIGNTQEPVFKYCREKNILVEAYSPLATGKLLESAEVSSVAQRLGVPLPKLCLKYCLQRGTLPLPKSVTPERIADNIVLDFDIPDEDMEILNKVSGLFPRPFRS